MVHSFRLGMTGSRTDFDDFSIRLPAWISAEVEAADVGTSDEERMKLAIRLAALNVAHGGGPFGALVCDSQSGAILAAGVNLVTREACSILHAEIVALMFAQKRLGSHTLAIGSYELVTSSEPCAQCLGAVCWSGVERLVCGATVRAAEALGFDEGPRRHDWQQQLRTRGIAVVTAVLAPEAENVFAEYVARGGHVYNGRPQI